MILHVFPRLARYPSYPYELYSLFVKYVIYNVSCNLQENAEACVKDDSIKNILFVLLLLLNLITLLRNNKSNIRLNFFICQKFKNKHCTYFSILECLALFKVKLPYIF